MTEKDAGKEVVKISKQILVFIGPEGSGKSENALRLSKESGLPYISTGNLLRDLAENDYSTVYGDMCRKMFAEDGYLDGEALLAILVNRLSMPDTEQGFILDGGMRTVEETDNFPSVLESAGRDKLPLKVIYLQIPKETSFERLLNSNRKNRKKDTIESITVRLGHFYNLLEERLDLIQHKDNWELKEVDASPQITEVYSSTVKIISEK